MEFSISEVIAVAVYSLMMCAGNLYMNLLNGTSKVVLQLVIYACFAVVSIPVMNYLCGIWRIVGIVVLPTVVYLMQSIFGRIQLKKIISHTASGIWDK